MKAELAASRMLGLRQAALLVTEVCRRALQKDMERREALPCLCVGAHVCMMQQVVSSNLGKIAGRQLQSAASLILKLYCYYYLLSVRALIWELTAVLPPYSKV